MLEKRVSTVLENPEYYVYVQACQGFAGAIFKSAFMPLK